jgi:hypothetical protein
VGRQFVSEAVGVIISAECSWMDIARGKYYRSKKLATIWTTTAMEI